MTAACMGGWCRDRNACALYHAADRRWPVERLCGDKPQPVRIVPINHEQKRKEEATQ